MDIEKKEALPYVYKCVEKSTGNYYIGYRYKNRVPAEEDLGVHYYTSNKYVKENFDNFDVEIISEFPDRKSAFQYETDLIRETKSDKQINSNKHNKPRKEYKKSEITLHCQLPGCGKYINSSIKRFCCQTHAAKYAALRSHGKV